MRRYYVYILANRSRTLYTGVTNDLEHRVRQHKSGVGSEFTKRYRITRLVYYESFTEVTQAIEWEKRIKGWVRAKKIALIQARNEHWSDLAADWFIDEAPANPSPVGQGARDSSLRSE